MSGAACGRRSFTTFAKIASLKSSSSGLMEILVGAVSGIWCSGGATGCRARIFATSSGVISGGGTFMRRLIALDRSQLSISLDTRMARPLACWSGDFSLGCLLAICVGSYKKLKDSTVPVRNMRERSATPRLDDRISSRCGYVSSMFFNSHTTSKRQIKQILNRYPK